MKHILNLLIFLALVFFAIGIASLQKAEPDSVWFLAYIPWIILAILWGFKINEDYKYEK